MNLRNRETFIDLYEKGHEFRVEIRERQMKKVMALNSLCNLLERKLDRKKLVAFSDIQRNQINVRLTKPAQLSLDTIQTDHSVETSKVKYSAEIPGMTAAQSIFKSPTNGSN